MMNFEYVRASTAAGAVSMLTKQSDAVFIAGGTNLVDLMKRGVVSPMRLIDINTLPLKEITLSGNKVTIGALALNSAVSEHPLVIKHFPLLSYALKAGASQQLRNMATVGGNMMQRTRCSYFYDTVMPCNKREPGTGCGAMQGINRMHAIFGSSENCIAVHPSDMCVALAALDASVIIRGAKGDRKILFTDFHRLPGNTPEKDNNLQPGELITHVEIPVNAFQQHAYYLKIRDRASYAFALVSVAAALEMQGNKISKARLAMGGVAHKPWRLTEAEAFLKGKEATETNFKAAAALAMQGAKAYEHNSFKLQMAPNAIAEALKKATSKA